MVRVTYYSGNEAQSTHTFRRDGTGSWYCVGPSEPPPQPDGGAVLTTVIESLGQAPRTLEGWVPPGEIAELAGWADS